jgi:uncharacterized HAD superfamily protein
MRSEEKENTHLAKSLAGRELWFDLDGTLALAAEPIVRKFNQDYGTELTIADITHFWVLSKHLRLLDPNMDEETARHIEYWNYWAKGELLSQAPVIPGALEVIKRLCAVQQQANLTINIITSREPDLADCTHQWLKNNRFLDFIDPKNVHHRGPGSMSGHGFKESKVRGGIVFDDSVYDAKRILEGDDQGTWVIWLPYLDEIGTYSHERLVVIKEMASDRDFRHVYNELLRWDFSR